MSLSRKNEVDMNTLAKMGQAATKILADSIGNSFLELIAMKESNFMQKNNEKKYQKNNFSKNINTNIEKNVSHPFIMNESNQFADSQKNRQELDEIYNQNKLEDQINIILKVLAEVVGGKYSMVMQKIKSGQNLTIKSLKKEDLFKEKSKNANISQFGQNFIKQEDFNQQSKTQNNIPFSINQQYNALKTDFVHKKVEDNINVYLDRKNFPVQQNFTAPENNNIIKLNQNEAISNVNSRPFTSIQKLNRLSIPIPTEQPIFVEDYRDVIIERPHYVDRIVEVRRNVEIEKEYTIDKYIDTEVIHHIDVPIHIEKPIHVLFDKHLTKYIEILKESYKDVEVLVEVQIPIERIVEKKIKRDIIVPKTVERELFLEQQYETFVDVIIEYEKVIETPIYIEKVIENVVDKIVEKQVYVEYERFVEVPKEVFVDKIIYLETTMVRPVYIENVIEEDDQIVMNSNNLNLETEIKDIKLKIENLIKEFRNINENILQASFNVSNESTDIIEFRIGHEENSRLRKMLNDLHDEYNSIVEMKNEKCLQQYAKMTQKKGGLKSIITESVIHNNQNNVHVEENINKNHISEQDVSKTQISSIFNGLGNGSFQEQSEKNDNTQSYSRIYNQNASSDFLDQTSFIQTTPCFPNFRYKDKQNDVLEKNIGDKPIFSFNKNLIKSTLADQNAKHLSTSFETNTSSTKRVQTSNRDSSWSRLRYAINGVPQNGPMESWRSKTPNFSSRKLSKEEDFERNSCYLPFDTKSRIRNTPPVHILE